MCVRLLLYVTHLLIISYQKIIKITKKKIKNYLKEKGKEIYKGYQKSYQKNKNY